VLCAALAGHPRLHTIDLSSNSAYGVYADVAAALCALVAANAPALQQLHVNHAQLNDAAMGPLVEALRHNTHLRVLDVTCNDVSESFERDRLLPAVRANSSLRTLVVDELFSRPVACEAAASFGGAAAPRVCAPR
jgi:hypothetical protein